MDKSKRCAGNVILKATVLEIQKKKINPYSCKAFYIVKQLARNNKGRVNTLKTGI